MNIYTSMIIEGKNEKLKIEADMMEHWSITSGTIGMVSGPCSYLPEFLMIMIEFGFIMREYKTNLV